MAKVYSGTTPQSQFVDLNKIAEKAQTDIALGELARETKRQKWKDDYEVVRKEQQSLESTGSEQFNDFVGEWSGALQDQALKLKNGLESGDIKSRDYTANWANLKASNDQLISSQKTYKERSDKVYEEFNNGTGSLANVQALNNYNEQMNLKGLKAVANTQGGIDLYDEKEKKIINSFALSNLTKVNVQMFDRGAAAKTLVDQFGTKITRDSQGNQRSTVEIGGEMFELSKPGSEANTKFNEAIKDSAMSTLLRGNNMASYLIDGPAGYELTTSEVDAKAEGSKKLLVKEDGTIDIPTDSKAYKEAIEAFTKDIRNALPFEEKAPLPERQSPYKEQVRNVKETEISTLGNVDKVVTGTNAESQQAIDTMLAHINRKNEKSGRIKTRYQNIVRSEDGQTITVNSKDENGIQKSDVYPADGSQRILMEIFYPDNEISTDELMKNYQFGTLKTKDDEGNSINVGSERTKAKRGRVNFAENKMNPEDPKSKNVQTALENATSKPDEMTRTVNSILNTYTDEDFTVTYKDKKTGGLFNGLGAGDNIIVTNSKGEQKVLGSTKNPGEVSSALQKYINRINDQQGGLKPTPNGKPPSYQEWKNQNPEGSFNDYKKLYKN